uniref:Uncharacterized protein n=1 Tax=uncultured Desulfobacterium sp. TaxID=201089 RepID=E1YC49_9BACT|nr:unknown protein [uncultured Desulfobacterium sp.]
MDLPLESDLDDGISRKNRQEQVLFLILISILERAYLMYHDQSTDIKKRQWTGWVEYIRDYCRKENFRRRWPTLGPQFDKGFVTFMEKNSLRN